MDRPKVVLGLVTNWVGYAEWLEAENAILQNNNEALNKDDKTLKDHIELLESDGDKLREALESMAMVLCNPEGKCCIDGTDADRAVIDLAMAALEKNNGTS
jgi:hypothetical protein